MKNSIIVATGLAASTALAGQCGSAHVVNQCSYEVYLCDVPAAGGGYTEIDQTLAANGGSWSQQYTELSNQQGWSIKLSKDTSLAQIMQFEYTYHNDGMIWYDLSDVNGNPWDGNWEITSDNDQCHPKQQAYRFSTDDAYGMQACSDDTSVTVTLCSGDSGTGSSGSAPAPAPAAPAPSSAAPAPTTTSAAPPPPPSSTETPYVVAFSSIDEQKNPSTTMATSAVTPAPAAPAPADPHASVVVVVTTEIAYTTVEVPEYPAERDVRHHHVHAHHPRHPHGRRL